MASIRQLKKSINAVREAFHSDCAILFMFSDGNEKFASALEALNDEVQAQWDAIHARAVGYDRTASKKAIRRHFEQLYADAERLSNESAERLMALHAGQEQ